MRPGKGCLRGQRRQHRPLSLLAVDGGKISSHFRSLPKDPRSHQRAEGSPSLRSHPEGPAFSPAGRGISLSAASSRRTRVLTGGPRDLPLCAVIPKDPRSHQRVEGSPSLRRHPEGPAFSPAGRCARDESKFKLNCDPSSPFPFSEQDRRLCAAPPKPGYTPPFCNHRCREEGRMTIEEKIEQAIALGKTKASDILAERAEAHTRRAAALQANQKKMKLSITVSPAGAAASEAEFQTAGFLAAAGDSWFDYPLHDVLKLLEDDHGYNVESTAHKGDPIEKMAYTGGQLDDFARKLEKIQARGAVPKAVLVSGGGDDIAGAEFGMLLNNAFSPIAGWDDDIVDGVVNQRLLTAYVKMLTTITDLCQTMFSEAIPILVHGYDYPVPDGRGFLGGWPFPGPWLDPGFREKNFDNNTPEDLQVRIGMMQTVMDQFNSMVQTLPAQPGFTHVRYIDLRGTLSNHLTDYKDCYTNDTPPTEKGFAAVADKFATVLASLP